MSYGHLFQEVSDVKSKLALVETEMEDRFNAKTDSAIESNPAFSLAKHLTYTKHNKLFQVLLCII